MKPSDRPAFLAALKRLCVVHERRIDGESFDALCEAYWTALQGMGWPIFEAAIARAVSTSERFPRPATLWGMAKDAPRQERQASPPVGDDWHAAGQRIMFAWLWDRVKRGQVLAPFELEQVIAAKARIVEQFRTLYADHDPEATVTRLRRLFVAEAERIAA